MKSVIYLIFLWVTFASPAIASPDLSRVIQARVLPGWTDGTGDHIAALQFTLAPGWKTYWRAPGDAGIPPEFDFGDSKNLASFAPIWPVPAVVWQNGMRTIVYDRDVILPLRLAARDKAKPITLAGTLNLGVCKDICMPIQLTLRADLPRDSHARDPRIVAAMLNVPLTASEAGVRHVRCGFRPSSDGYVIDVEIEMQSAGAPEEVVFELAGAPVWIGTPRAERRAGTLSAVAPLESLDDGPVAFQRKNLRISILGQKRSVDISGCGS